MKYVLIFFILYRGTGSPETAEFGDQQACEAGREIVLKTRRENGLMKFPGADFAVCIPYSTERKDG